MDTSTYKSRVVLTQSYKINNFVENICQEHNISNYYGAISVSIERIIELINSFYGKDYANKYITFCFEQCVGGVSFSIESIDDIFSNIIFDKSKELESESDINVFLISKLSDKIIVSENGKKIELLFFVNGIEPELLLQRQEKIKEFNSNRMHQNIK
jgi:hypothetical protein